jgi:predicted Holliday junction resolvase-like endonuclease
MAPSDHLIVNIQEDAIVDTLTIVVILVSIVLLILFLSTRTELVNLKTKVNEEAQRQFHLWKETELSSYKREIADLAIREAAVQLQSWKFESAAAIRQDAIAKSQSVVMGKYSEHLAPYMGHFEFDPRDARFIGSPIDLVVFDGISGEGEVRAVVFLEIKTGDSNLSTRQRRVRDAVMNGRVLWKEMRIDKEDKADDRLAARNGRR